MRSPFGSTARSTGGVLAPRARVGSAKRERSDRKAWRPSGESGALGSVEHLGGRRRGVLRGPRGNENPSGAMIRREILARDALDVLGSDLTNGGQVRVESAPVADQLEAGEQHRLIEVRVLGEHELRFDLVLRLG